MLMNSNEYLNIVESIKQDIHGAIPCDGQRQS